MTNEPTTKKKKRAAKMRKKKKMMMKEKKMATQKIITYYSTGTTVFECGWWMVDDGLIQNTIGTRTTIITCGLVNYYTSSYILHGDESGTSVNAFSS